mmetsp:Transcript_13228/g.32124  ORF Transcript_13228/g.32124 Transcript_13228/m.32124 type:complete len:232 (+) Transcript_13228:175-870(+)
MNVARTAVLGVGDGHGSAAHGSSAAQDAMMKLAGSLPGVDAGQLYKNSSDAWQKATEGAKEGWGNFLSAAAWDPLGAPVVGSAGQVSRDASNIFDATLAHRAETQAESVKFVKGFERRLTRSEDLIAHAASKTEGCGALVEACKDKAAGVEKARDAAHAASKSIQAMLECEKQEEDARVTSAEARAGVLEKRREDVRAELNARREKVEQEFKDNHAILLDKYKSHDTEAFI